MCYNSQLLHWHKKACDKGDQCIYNHVDVGVTAANALMADVHRRNDERRAAERQQQPQTANPNQGAGQGAAATFDQQSYIVGALADNQASF